jgi:hypothetical protein
MINMKKENNNEEGTEKPLPLVEVPKSTILPVRARVEPAPLPVLKPVVALTPEIEDRGDESPPSAVALSNLERLNDDLDSLLNEEWSDNSTPTANENVPSENKPVLEAPVNQTPPDSHTKSKENFRGLARYKIKDKVPLGAGFHIVNKKKVEPVRGNVFAQISHRNWYLNGMRLILGTTAADADKDANITVDGVEGLLPRTIDWLHKMAVACNRIDPGSSYNEGRPYQFGVSIVLSREDFRTLEAEMSAPSSEHRGALAKAGARTEVIKSVIHNSRGIPMMLTIKFKNKKAGSGTHFIYLHSTTNLGGGKTDLSLTEGNLRQQANMLSEEFQWWIRALEKGNGLIAGIEGGLGGTARQANYSLLMDSIPARLIANDAIEYINVDPASWVHNNLTSEQASYHMNYTTTLLRKAWGSFAKPFAMMPINLVDRQRPESRQIRDLRASQAVLRSIFAGLSVVRPIKGDLSDQRWAVEREVICTDNQYLDIYNPDDKKKDNFVPQLRRIRTENSDYISRQRFERIGLGEASEDLVDTAKNLLERGRALAAIEHDCMPIGMYCTLELMVPANAGFSKQLVNHVGESLAEGLRRTGVEHVVTIYNDIVEGLTSCDDIIVTLTEDHAGTTLLMMKTDESDPHKRRKIVQNHKSPWTDQKWSKGCKAYNRLMREVQNAHLNSGLPSCVNDGKLIKIFAAHWYGGYFAKRPEEGYALGGPHDRPRKGRTIKPRGDE